MKKSVHIYLPCGIVETYEVGVNGVIDIIERDCGIWVKFGEDSKIVASDMPYIMRYNVNREQEILETFDDYTYRKTGKISSVQSIKIVQDFYDYDKKDVFIGKTVPKEKS